MMSKENIIMISILAAIVVMDLFLMMYVHKQVARLDSLIGLREDWNTSSVEDR